MFRPYNLTSLAAWTAGCLAGNEAYYRTKGSSQRTRLKSEPVILPVNPKIKKICDEVNRLADDFRLSAERNEGGKIEITPLVRLIAYYEWFQIRKEAIKAEIHNGNEERWLDSIPSYLDNIISGMRKILFDTITNLEERQKLVDLMKNRQESCQVKESSYKLIDSNSGRFFIRGKIS